MTNQFICAIIIYLTYLDNCIAHYSKGTNNTQLQIYCSLAWLSRHYVWLLQRLC
nr:MAG TPA: hypothetical protein [Caudoviricetes sp.]